MGRFEKYLFKKTNLHGGIQKLYRFENGYGASVVQNRYSYGGDQGLWEIAMISWEGDQFNLYYCEITNDDVLGYLPETSIDDVLERIKNY